MFKKYFYLKLLKPPDRGASTVSKLKIFFQGKTLKKYFYKQNDLLILLFIFSLMIYFLHNHNRYNHL